MHIYYECNPVRDLRVIPAANIITRACLAPCFFDGKSQYHTIPRRFSHYEARHFAGGKADKAVPGGEASKLYELNVWAMTCGRAKERIVSVQDELATKKRYVSDPDHDPSDPDPSSSPPTLLGLTHTRAGDLIVAGPYRTDASRLRRPRGGTRASGSAANGGRLTSHALSCLLSA